MRESSTYSYYMVFVTCFVFVCVSHVACALAVVSVLCVLFVCGSVLVIVLALVTAVLLVLFVLVVFVVVGQSVSSCCVLFVIVFADGTLVAIVSV